jgi:hypothetical protein
MRKNNKLLGDAEDALALRLRCNALGVSVWGA